MYSENLGASLWYSFDDKKYYIQYYNNSELVPVKNIRTELSKLGNLYLTTGGDTANRRIDWCVEKSHSNDAVCITGLTPNSMNVFDWKLKPIRKRSKATISEYRGFKHRDLIQYAPKNKTPVVGYVIAITPKVNTLSFQGPTKAHTKVRINSCSLLWRFTNIIWLGTQI